MCQFPSKLLQIESSATRCLQSVHTSERHCLYKKTRFCQKFESWAFCSTNNHWKIGSFERDGWKSPLKGLSVPKVRPVRTVDVSVSIPKPNRWRVPVEGPGKSGLIFWPGGSNRHGPLYPASISFVHTLVTLAWHWHSPGFSLVCAVGTWQSSVLWI